MCTRSEKLASMCMLCCALRFMQLQEKKLYLPHPFPSCLVPNSNFKNKKRLEGVSVFTSICSFSILYRLFIPWICWTVGSVCLLYYATFKCYRKFKSQLLKNISFLCLYIQTKKTTDKQEIWQFVASPKNKWWVWAPNNSF